jgi:hypothetical protein
MVEDFYVRKRKRLLETAGQELVDLARPRDAGRAVVREDHCSSIRPD